MNAFMKWAASLLLVISSVLYGRRHPFGQCCSCRIPIRSGAVFPAVKISGDGNHIKDAISAGHSEICTIDRGGAENRRKESLKGIPTKPGFDRDEYHGSLHRRRGGADIRYVTPSDNRVPVHGLEIK